MRGATALHPAWTCEGPLKAGCELAGVYEQANGMRR